MKINECIIKDKYGNELSVHNRVSFDIEICSGYGEMGTIVSIERNTCQGEPYGDEFQYVCNIRWDCHGEVIGECFDLRDCVSSWKFVDKGDYQKELF